MRLSLRALVLILEAPGVSSNPSPLSCTSVCPITSYYAGSPYFQERLFGSCRELQPEKKIGKSCCANGTLLILLFFTHKRIGSRQVIFCLILSKFPPCYRLGTWGFCRSHYPQNNLCNGRGGGLFLPFSPEKKLAGSNPTYFCLHSKAPVLTK